MESFGQGAASNHGAAGGEGSKAEMAEFLDP